MEAIVPYLATSKLSHERHSGQASRFAVGCEHLCGTLRGRGARHGCALAGSPQHRHRLRARCNTPTHTIEGMRAELLALLVPPRCAACRPPACARRRACAARAGARCRGCAGPRCPRCALPRPCAPCPARSAAFAAAWAPVAYEGVARDARARAEVRGRATAGDVHGGADRRGRSGRHRSARDRVLVAVPAHPARRRARGFDPAELLARALARRTGLPVARALRRRGPAPRARSAPRRATRLAPRAARGRRPRPGPAPRRPGRRRPHHRRDAGRVRPGAAGGRREHGRGAHLGAHVAVVRRCRVTRDVHHGLHIRTSRRQEGLRMQIEVKGRNIPVTDELRELVERRFRKVAKQVSDLARLEVELREERNPAIPDSQVAEVTLYLKGVDAARRGGRARHGPLDQARAPRSSRARSSATATSAASAARRAPRRSPAPSSARSPGAPLIQAGEQPEAEGRPRPTRRAGPPRWYPDRHGHPGAGAPRRRGQEVQAVREARRADQRLRARARARVDEELRARMDALREQARRRREPRRPAARDLRGHPRGRQAHDGHAPLRRAADRRHGPARRLDRRDADRRGQDPDRHARRSCSTRWPARASTSSRSTTTWPAATPSG